MLYAAALRCRFNLGDKFAGNLRHAAETSMGLATKSKAPMDSALQGDRRALRAVGAHHDYRDAMAAHDFFEHVEAAHTWHFEVEGHHLRLDLFDLFQAKVAIHGGAHNLNRAVALQNLRESASA